MYKSIYVPVDNSDHSDRAVDVAVELGRSYESKMVGCHVYAARMHDYRFKQMEYTLPDEYLEETELERQRKIHDSLITMGLKLISDSYLSPMDRKCQEAGLEFEPRMMDGKHSTEIIRDIGGSEYDLVVMGAIGLGRSKYSQLGSVTERVARTTNKDLLVIRRAAGKNGKGNGDGHEPVADTILVGIDGSPQSFGALEVAIDFAKRFDKKVEAIAVYDPYLHYSVFNGIVDVLTEKAAKVFRFEEQNQLHEEIIDTGLAQIYQSHLDVAEKVAAERDFEITKTLLDGKAFPKILDHAKKTNPWLLVVGRIGIHSPKEEKALGSNTENLLRLCPCDTLLTTGLHYPALDVRAEETLRWTPEAEERFTRVPPLVRGIARTAIYRLAIEKGHSVISSTVLDEAMDRYMPKSAARATTKLAEELVLDRGRDISLCSSCGVAAMEPDPERCTVCGGTKFQVITPEMVGEIISMEGGTEEDTSYDGRKLAWTRDARNALNTMTDAYKRRRAKARVEKSARMRRMSTVTLEFARRIVEEETGEALSLPARSGSSGVSPAERDDGRKLIARDAKNTPLVSSFAWTEDAVERILRVPAGLMRDRTQERIELVATERKASTIDLTLAEEGVTIGRQMMAEMIKGYAGNREEARKLVASPKPGGDGGDSGRANDGTTLNESAASGDTEPSEAAPDDATPLNEAAPLNAAASLSAIRPTNGR